MGSWYNFWYWTLGSDFSEHSGEQPHTQCPPKEFSSKIALWATVSIILYSNCTGFKVIIKIKCICPHHWLNTVFQETILRPKYLSSHKSMDYFLQNSSWNGSGMKYRHDFSLEEIILTLCLHNKFLFHSVHWMVNYLGYMSSHYDFSPNSLSSHIRL